MAGPSPKAGGCHGQGTDEKQQGKEETESRPQQEEKGCRSLAVRGGAKPGPVDLQSAGQEGPVRTSARNWGPVAQGLARGARVHVVSVARSRAAVIRRSTVALRLFYRPGGYFGFEDVDARYPTQKRPLAGPLVSIVSLSLSACWTSRRCCCRCSRCCRRTTTSPRTSLRCRPDCSAT